MLFVVVDVKEVLGMAHLVADLSGPSEKSITKENTAHATST